MPDVNVVIDWGFAALLWVGVLGVLVVLIGFVLGRVKESPDGE